jgi:hypothetical protein
MFGSEYENDDDRLSYDLDEVEQAAYQAYLESCLQAERDRQDELLASVFMPIVQTGDCEPF